MYSWNIIGNDFDKTVNVLQQYYKNSSSLAYDKSIQYAIYDIIYVKFTDQYIKKHRKTPVCTVDYLMYVLSQKIEQEKIYADHRFLELLRLVNEKTNNNIFEYFGSSPAFKIDEAITLCHSWMDAFNKKIIQLPASTSIHQSLTNEIIVAIKNETWKMKEYSEENLIQLFDLIYADEIRIKNLTDEELYRLFLTSLQNYQYKFAIFLLCKKNYINFQTPDIENYGKRSPYENFISILFILAETYYDLNTPIKIIKSYTSALLTHFETEDKPKLEKLIHIITDIALFSLENQSIPRLAGSLKIILFLMVHEPQSLLEVNNRNENGLFFLAWVMRKIEALDYRVHFEIAELGSKIITELKKNPYFTEHDKPAAQLMLEQHQAGISPVKYDQYLTEWNECIGEPIHKALVMLAIYLEFTYFKDHIRDYVYEVYNRYPKELVKKAGYFYTLEGLLCALANKINFDLISPNCHFIAVLAVIHDKTDINVHDYFSRNKQITVNNKAKPDDTWLTLICKHHLFLPVPTTIEKLIKIELETCMTDMEEIKRLIGMSDLDKGFFDLLQHFASIFTFDVKQAMDLYKFSLTKPQKKYNLALYFFCRLNDLDTKSIVWRDALSLPHQFFSEISFGKRLFLNNPFITAISNAKEKSIQSTTMIELIGSFSERQEDLLDTDNIRQLRYCTIFYLDLHEKRGLFDNWDMIDKKFGECFEKFMINELYLQVVTANEKALLNITESLLPLNKIDLVKERWITNKIKMSSLQAVLEILHKEIDINRFAVLIKIADVFINHQPACIHVKDSKGNSVIPYLKKNRHIFLNPLNAQANKEQNQLNIFSAKLLSHYCWQSNIHGFFNSSLDNNFKQLPRELIDHISGLGVQLAMQEEEKVSSEQVLTLRG